jgi:hypothetical protein
MAVEKALYTDAGLLPPIPEEEEEIEGEGEEVEIGVVNPDALVIETDDGGAIIDFTGGLSDEPLDDIPHDANLADYIDEMELARIGSDIKASVDADKASRSDWEQAYTEGLDLLGLKIEDRTEPWNGACGAFHPLLTESVVRFQSQAIMEVYPASGPVRTKVVGRSDNDKDRQAKRVQEDMNYLITEEMPEFRSETERMLFNLPLCGSAFKKMWFDPNHGRPMSMFVPADDFIVAYGTADLRSCPRYAHIMRKPKNEILKLQVSGFYRDVELDEDSGNIEEIRDKKDNIIGISANADNDDRVSVYEVHLDYDLPEPFSDPNGIGRPYVITFTNDGTVLSIRRNWYEDDEKKQKRLHFVHYCYMPGLGFYGTGLIHLLGGLTKSSTSILRQLVDAGTLANLPSGFKVRGVRIKGDDAPLRPGEWRDADIYGDNLQNGFMPLPYKEPSTVLYQLLNTLVEEGRRVGSIAEMDLNKMSGEQPVGTTLALMERSLKVMSAVQARLHASQKQELKILASIVRDYMPKEYPFEIEGSYSREEDYDGRVDVLPVSDPNASTMAQKVVQYQAALQLAQSAPQVYDIPLLHRGMLEVLQIKNADKIIKLEDDYKPLDPVMENMSIMKQEPVKAFLYQDHEAHIRTHMAALQDPKLMEIVGQSPNAEAIQAAMTSHITEHVAYAYRRKIEEQLGTPLPDVDEPLPRDIEVDLSKVMADAAEKLLGKNQQEAQEEKAKQIQEDPMYQLQKREIEIKERTQQDNAEAKRAELALEKLKIELDAKLKEMDIRSDEKIAGVQVGAEIGKQAREIASRERTEGAKIGQRVAEDYLKQGIEKEKLKNERARTGPGKAQS